MKLLLNTQPQITTDLIAFYVSIAVLLMVVFFVIGVIMDRIKERHQEQRNAEIEKDLQRLRRLNRMN